MRVTLSAAVTADGYMDDDSPRRLIISTPGDWEEVYRLRAAHDAILAGAETLRRDDPSLLVRDQVARARRVQAGLKPDIAKVTLTRSGGLSPRLRFFTAGDADRYVFSPGEITGLQNIATVISTSEAITAKYIVTELEKRGIEHLMVEGGAGVLRMFLDEGMADTLRLAVNPRLRLGRRGGARFGAAPPQSVPHTCEEGDGMEVTTYTLHPDTTGEDLRYLRMAVDEGRKCTPGPTSYCVGAVVATADGRIFAGYTHETSATHQGAGGRSRAPRRRDVLLDGAVLASGERARKLHTAHYQAWFRPGGLRTLRARLFRMLPRSADPARSGRRRQGIPGAGQRRMGSQRAPEAMNRA